MSRTPSDPTTALGAAMRARRGARHGHEVAAELGIDRTGYHRIEIGSRGPAPETAMKLARWLGWPLEEVFAAARRPPGPAPAPDQDAAAPVAPLEAVAIGYRALLLRLPGGAIVGPWTATSEGAMERRSTDGQVMARAITGFGWAMVHGRKDMSTGPAATVEARCDLIDQDLVSKGAQIVATESA